MTALHNLNHLKKDGVWVGQRLKVPAAGAAAGTQRSAKTAGVSKTSRHKVVRGDTLSSIAAHYGVSVTALKSANRLKSDVAPLDRTLTIPHT
ncbi:Probable peptidoglycan endopeptidase LytE precursor [Serratia rubidaea]|uniref:Probable peptidoglycan endopeptidase LytE n=2 Tax=Serratia rubidaea TaxID=61652 RepID=A0A3S4FXZ4_SERRU|nr:Probable peptidoglycan endopeptidase LytE precursor [Serratia rubidaea]VTP59955.1 Probable peptidoglycan endopeptidase LytE precursor [Serratia rubidaea]